MDTQRVLGRRLRHTYGWGLPERCVTAGEVSTVSNSIERESIRIWRVLEGIDGHGGGQWSQISPSKTVTTGLSEGCLKEGKTEGWNRLGKHLTV